MKTEKNLQSVDDEVGQGGKGYLYIGFLRKKLRELQKHSSGLKSIWSFPVATKSSLTINPSSSTVPPSQKKNE
jgi:hypothetical protein